MSAFFFRDALPDLCHASTYHRPRTFDIRISFPANVKSLQCATTLRSVIRCRISLAPLCLFVASGVDVRHKREPHHVLSSVSSGACEQGRVCRVWRHRGVQIVTRAIVSRLVVASHEPTSHGLATAFIFLHAADPFRRGRILAGPRRRLFPRTTDSDAPITASSPNPSSDVPQSTRRGG